MYFVQTNPVRGLGQAGTDLSIVALGIGIVSLAMDLVLLSFLAGRRR